MGLWNRNPQMRGKVTQISDRLYSERLLMKDLQEFEFYNYDFITRNAHEKVLQYTFS